LERSTRWSMRMGNKAADLWRRGPSRGDY
jgi:hypothetical protein